MGELSAWQITSLFTFQIFTASLAVAVAVLAWRRRYTPGTLAFALMMLALAEWSLASALEEAAIPFANKVLFARFQYLGISSTAPLWFLFIFGYTRQEHNLFMRRPWLLFIIPVITVGMVFTNGTLHKLIWPSITPSSSIPGAALIYDHGAYFWFSAVYNYIVLLTGTLALILAIIRFPHIYRRQAVSLLTASGIPWISNIIYLAGLSPVPGVDPTPMALTTSGIIFAWSIFRQKLLELVPVARDTVIEGLADGILVLDEHNLVADINLKARELLGNMNDPLVGQNAKNVLVAWPELIERYRDVQTAQAEIHVGGVQPLDIELRIDPLHDQKGNFLGRLILLRDITERKRSQEQLRLQGVALETTANAVVITHHDGSVLWVNPSFTRLTGYTSSEIQGQNLRILRSGVHDQVFYQSMWRTILNGKVWKGELVNRRKDGTLYNEEQTITPLHNERNEISHFVAVKEDISERKQIEKLRDDLMHTLVHDLRNPLSALSTSLDVLQAQIAKTGGQLPDNQKRTMQNMQTSITRMTNLVSSILDISRLENKQMPLERTSILPIHLVNAILQTQAPLANSHGLVLVNAVPAELPPVYIDANLVSRVLHNLIDNAIKFTSNGGALQISGQYIASDHQVQLSIHDSGPGIPEEIKDRLFQKFTPGAQAGHGSGLGLAFCRLVIEAHGGHIWVDSNHQGATFHFTLPTQQ